MRSHIATALGHATAERIDPERALKDLGFDSLIAVDFRNRLGAATGLRLPATLAFNHPTPAAVADYLKDRLGAGRQGADASILAELDRIEDALRKASDGSRQEITERLRHLLSKHSATEAALNDVASATDDEMFNLIDNELGIA